jgi:RNA polymerase sigma-70 factor (ECF subfamily)
VRGSERTPAPDLVRQRRVVDAYLAATRKGDFAALLELLDPDVVLRADAASSRTNVPIVLRGARAVVEGAIASSARARVTEPALVDGAIGLVMPVGGRLSVALTFTQREDRITAIEVITEPSRLAALDVALAP